MDVEYLSSPAAPQMDLGTVLLPMDKFLGFPSEAMPPVEFPLGASPPPFIDTPRAMPPTSTTILPAALQDPASASAVHLNSIAAAPRSPAKPACDVDHPLGHSPQTAMATMREMVFRMAAMQPIHIDPESVKPPKRRNVRISQDPQSVAARHRRERISERIRILQRLVPGGTKMDTASMLDEAIHYVKFLKTQVQSLEMAAATRNACFAASPAAAAVSSGGFSCFFGRAHEQQQQQLLMNQAWTTS